MFAAWIRNNPYHREIKDWITFEALTEYRGGGFDTSSGTYTVPEDGIYIFGLQAQSSWHEKSWTRIDFYQNDFQFTVVSEGNEKDHWNNLGTTWTDTLKKGDKIRLKVAKGSVDGYF